MIKSHTIQTALTGGGRLEHLERAAKAEIRELNKTLNGQICAGISMGDDSQVLLDIMMKLLGDKVPYVFHNTGVEFRETLDHMEVLEDFYDIHFDVTRPTKKGRLIHQIAYRNKNSMRDHGEKTALFTILKRRPCCDTLKKEPLVRHMKELGIFKEGASLEGVRREESKRRSGYKCLLNRNKKHNFLSAHPLRNWLKEDILNYLKKYRIPRNPVYEFYDGCGCAVCPCPNQAIDYYGQIREHHPRWYRWIYRHRPTQRPDFYRHTWGLPDL